MSLLQCGVAVNCLGGDRGEYLAVRLMTQGKDLGASGPAYLEQLLNVGARCDVWDRQRRTPLICAVEFEAPVAMIERLIVAGADPNAKDSDGETALFKKPKIDVARLLVAAGANVDHVARNGWTPLMTAAAWGDVDLASFLLVAGAEPNQIDRFNRTALHCLIRSSVAYSPERIEIVNALLQSGVDISIRDHLGQDAIKAAECEKHADIVDHLRGWVQTQVASCAIKGIDSTLRIMSL